MEATQEDARRPEGIGLLARLQGELRSGQPHVRKYQLLAQKGVGGYGTVFHARDVELGRDVALKILTNPTIARIERFKREARALAKVAHRHIIGVYETFEEEETHFIALEWVDGPTLHKWLEGRHGRGEILEKFIDAGEALQALHKLKMYHRDFKPENCAINTQGELKILDFGLVRMLDELPAMSVAGSVCIAAPQSTQGQSIGTLRFVSPEMRARVSVDGKCDQYSFCIALLDALHGNASRQVHKPGEIREQLDGLPAALRMVLARGLREDPKDRWGDMGLLVARLTAYHRRWRRRAALAGTVAACALLGASAVAVFAPRSDLARVLRVDDGEVACERSALVEADAVTAPAPAIWRDTADGGELPYAVHTSLRVALERWREARVSGCVAYRHGRFSDRIYSAHIECMELGRERLGAVARRFVNRQFASEGEYHEAVATLPPVERCLDLGRLWDGPARSTATGEDTSTRTIRSGLAEVELDILQRRNEDARRRVEPLIEQARRDGARVYEAELRRQLGWLHMQLGNRVLAESNLERAFELGLATDAHPTMYLAAVNMAWYLGSQQDRQDEAEVWLHRADALATNEVAHIDPEVQAEFFNTKGWIARRRGRIHDSEAALAQAVAVIEEAFGRHSLYLRRPINYLGLVAMQYRDDPERALALYARARNLLTRELGQDHPLLVVPDANSAMAALALGDEESARTFALSAERLTEVNHLGRDSAAMEAHLVLGMVALHEGDLEVASRRFDAAFERFARKVNTQGIYVAAAWLGAGRVALARGEVSAAIDMFERALTLRRQPHNNDSLFSLPEAEFWLAVALWTHGMERQRAVEHFASARRHLDEVERGVGTGRLAAALAEWEARISPERGLPFGASPE